MLKSVLLIVIVMGMSIAHAEAEKLSSISYQNLIRCFPELINQDISSNVDLNRLKEIVDNQFVTSRTQLDLRKAYFKDFDGNEMMMEIRYHFVNIRKTTSQLKLLKANKKGEWSDVVLPTAQREDPKQEFIDGFLLGSKVESDETYYNDTKLQKIEAVYRKNFKEIIEYSLNDALRKRSVRCEKKEGLGTLCICSQSAK